MDAAAKVADLKRLTERLQRQLKGDEDTAKETLEGLRAELATERGTRGQLDAALKTAKSEVAQLTESLKTAELAASEEKHSASLAHRRVQEQEAASVALMARLQALSNVPDLRPSVADLARDMGIADGPSAVEVISRIRLQMRALNEAAEEGRALKRAIEGSIHGKSADLHRAGVPLAEQVRLVLTRYEGEGAEAAAQLRRALEEVRAAKEDLARQKAKTSSDTALAYSKIKELRSLVQRKVIADEDTEANLSAIEAALSSHVDEIVSMEAQRSEVMQLVRKMRQTMDIQHRHQQQLQQQQQMAAPPQVVVMMAAAPSHSQAASRTPTPTTHYTPVGTPPSQAIHPQEQMHTNNQYYGVASASLPRTLSPVPSFTKSRLHL
eukprot:GDKK01063714.1.p1 GENE.GDKK01063714.1~~GDKK01063714.1.p1  ORF type:complete len:403 (+),score=31.79 GDKK01063714.1:68-1210(+)